MEAEAHYWQVEPTHIRVSQNFNGLAIPLCVRGAPAGGVEGLQFESVDAGIAQVEDGMVLCGSSAGSTLILVYNADRTSIRYVQVEVLPPTGQGY